MIAINPANKNPVAVGERKRIPMSVPVQKLSVPEIPGYHLHWFNGTPERIARAQQGGYEFVDSFEVQVNSVGLGNESTQSGNTDMGSRVSIVGGTEVDPSGQPVRLILMKIKQEWREQDMKLVEDRNDSVANALMGGVLGAEKDGPGDTAQRYVDAKKTVIPEMFKRKRPKVA